MSYFIAVLSDGTSLEANFDCTLIPKPGNPADPAKRGSRRFIFPSYPPVLIPVQKKSPVISFVLLDARFFLQWPSMASNLTAIYYPAVYSFLTMRICFCCLARTWSQ